MMRSVIPMKTAKIGYIVISILFCVLGVVLLARPETSVPWIGRLLGIGMIVFGLIKLVGYFSKDLFRLAFQYDLAFGVLLIVLGTIVVAHPAGTMRFLSIMLGIPVLADGLFKVQIAVDAKRFGMPKWWTVLLLAVCSVALGIVLLLYPFGTALLAIRFMGLAMILYGIQELTSTAYTVNTKPNGIVIDVDDFKEC